MGQIVGRRIRVRGRVQGVGFRPHVFRLAAAHGLVGHVSNDGAGVAIEAWGAAAALRRFLSQLETQAPPLARVTDIEAAALDGAAPAGFTIGPSGGGSVSTAIAPDAAICAACLEDIDRRDDRRFGYAFTNCTHCGPRFSIVRSIPYDRANTTMDAFEMCAACQAEYHDPRDRRFHAQPNACPDCGPRLWLETAEGGRMVEDPIAEAARHIRGGAVVAIKGIGGFHLACDAVDGGVVETLRRRKRRPGKPLAVMARDVEQVRLFCRLTDMEEALLQSDIAPILLLPKAGDSLADAIAPDIDRIGVMLPYTPLHHLLLARLPHPLVMTSGNRSDEPQAVDNAEAAERLAGIADAWLMHDRAIVNRLDDSVMRFSGSDAQVLRRGRGLAPAPIPLAPSFGDAPPVLAMGGQLKSAFCLLREGSAILSQHMGDLEQPAARAGHRTNLTRYRELFRFDPAVVAVDTHPDYAATVDGSGLARQTGARLLPVQHHHAHFAAVLAEHGVDPDDDASLGIILDGLGHGDDGTLWGGEVLVGGFRHVRRAAHFAPVPLPGGARAMVEPWRNLVAHLHAAFGGQWTAAISGTPVARLLADMPIDTTMHMIERGTNSPLSSSAGRLFDAVAAALGVRLDRQRYEGQAAMELETLARPHASDPVRYPVDRTPGDPVVLSWEPLWRALIADLRQDTEPGRVAARFHAGLAWALADCADELAGQAGARRIALSGGVMQNEILLDALRDRLVARGHAVLIPRLAPANDGGLALGQAAVAAAVSC